jgi:hypothetical protein
LVSRSLHGLIAGKRHRARLGYVRPMLMAAACALLTSAEILAVQGEAPSQAKASSGESKGVSSEQCFFELPTFARSISLQISRGSGVRGLWRKSFHEKHEDQEGGRAPLKERVRGLGEEAYFVDGPRLGGLYVLRKDVMLRLAIGGSEEKASKLRRLKQLAARM